MLKCVVSELGTQENHLAKALNRNVSLFLKDLLSIMDRGVVMDLVCRVHAFLVTVSTPLLTSSSATDLLLRRGSQQPTAQVRGSADRLRPRALCAVQLAAARPHRRDSWPRATPVAQPLPRWTAGDRSRKDLCHLSAREDRCAVGGVPQLGARYHVLPPAQARGGSTLPVEFVPTCTLLSRTHHHDVSNSLTHSLTHSDVSALLVATFHSCCE